VSKSEPGAQKWPGLSQGTGLVIPVVLQKKPAQHFSQEEAADVDKKVPAAHSMHVGAPGGENLPAAQSLHEEAPDGENLPAAHEFCLSLVEPSPQ
jgi:hypothetical protein